MLRNEFAGSPAYLIWNGITMEMSDDWNAETEENLKERRTNLRGLVGRGLNYRSAKITARPVATSANLGALLAKLHPYNASDRGRFISDLLGGTDLPAIIQGKHGRKLEFQCAFLTKEPDMIFAPNEDLFDTFELTCLLNDGGSNATLADFITEEASAYAEPTLDPLAIISERYNLSWGNTSPFDAIETDEKGVKLRPGLQLKEKITSRDGLLNYQLDGKSAEVSFTPANLDTQDFLSLLPAVERGQMIGQAGLPLTVSPVSGVGPQLVCPLAVPMKKPLLFGTEGRYGEIVMAAERVLVEGTMQEPYSLAYID